MNSIEQARFKPFYQQMQQALLLQGMRPKTIAAYSRGVSRVADYVDRCPDNLTADELKSYFASLVVSHSWSTVPAGAQTPAWVHNPGSSSFTNLSLCLMHLDQSFWSRSLSFARRVPKLELGNQCKGIVVSTES